MPRKTLVCVISETREAHVVWDSFKKNVIDVLDADLAVCVATPPDYDYSNPYWQNAKYKWSSPEYDNWMDAIEYAKRTDYPTASEEWRRLLDIPDNWFAPVNGHRGAGGILIFFRWLLMHNLKKEDVFKTYDRIIVTRSDYMFLCPHPPMELMDPNFVWVPDGEKHTAITDRYAILSEKNAYAYLNILETMFTQPERMYNILSPWCNLEKIVLANLLIGAGPNSYRFFPFVMYSVRSKGTNTRWAPGIWNDDLGYAIKYQTEYELATFFQNIYKTPSDWFNPKPPENL